MHTEQITLKNKQTRKVTDILRFFFQKLKKNKKKKLKEINKLYF